MIGKMNHSALILKTQAELAHVAPLRGGRGRLDTITQS